MNLLFAVGKSSKVACFCLPNISNESILWRVKQPLRNIFETQYRLKMHQCIFLRITIFSFIRRLFTQIVEKMVIQKMKEKWHDKIFYNNPKYLGIQCLWPLGSKSYSSIYNLNFQERDIFTTFTVLKRFKKSFLIPWYLLKSINIKCDIIKSEAFS